jgi:hypothetical protein
VIKHVRICDKCGDVIPEKAPFYILEVRLDVSTTASPATPSIHELCSQGCITAVFNQRLKGVTNGAHTRDR